MCNSRLFFLFKYLIHDVLFFFFSRYWATVHHFKLHTLINAVMTLQSHNQRNSSLRHKTYVIDMCTNKVIIDNKWCMHACNAIDHSHTLRKKGFIGVLYMKHKVLYSTPKNLLC